MMLLFTNVKEHSCMYLMYCNVFREIKNLYIMRRINGEINGVRQLLMAQQGGGGGGAAQC